MAVVVIRMAAAPMPCATRQASSAAKLVETAASSEAMTNTASPAISTGLRP